MTHYTLVTHLFSDNYYRSQTAQNHEQTTTTHFHFFNILRTDVNTVGGLQHDEVKAFRLTLYLLLHIAQLIFTLAPALELILETVEKNLPVEMALQPLPAA